jgi:serpin B
MPIWFVGKNDSIQMLFSFDMFFNIMSDSWQALFFIIILLSSVSVIQLTSAQISIDKTYLSPKKQVAYGASPENVVCLDGLVLMKKLSDNSPACVKPQTAQKLVERGWGLKISPGNLEQGTSHANKTITATNMVDANNIFMLDYYSAIREGSDNIFFSPWSIMRAFSVAHEGAGGKTANEMASVFHFPDDAALTRNSIRTIQNNLNVNDSGYELRDANALWIKHDFAIKKEFVDIAKLYYDSEVTQVSFPQDESTINSWVEQKTNGKIKDLVSGTDEYTRLVITNAVYFNGTWQTKFEKNATYDADFRVTKEKTVKVPMMSIKSQFPYAETDNLQMLEMPYKGDRLSMVVLLPKNDDLGSLENSLTQENLASWQKEMINKTVDVFVPKFKLETKYDLKEQLSKMGISLAFDPDHADFTKISNEQLYISAAVHKAFVNVNEKGTEAAAATGLTMTTTSVPPPPPVFRADHPFIFMIKDNNTGLVLFMGRVVDPTA